MALFIPPSVRQLTRFLPLVVAILVIAMVVKFQPQAVKQLIDQIEIKFNLKNPTTLALEDPIQAVNKLRQNNKLKTVLPNSLLDQTAKLLALSIIDAKGDENKVIPIKQAAIASGYGYQSIVYLAAIDAEPLIQQPTATWIQNQDKDLLNTDFSQIGVAQVGNVQATPKQLVTVLVLAKPLLSNANATQAIARPEYTGVQLWAEIQKYRREHGVPEFKQDNVLCTLASIRVNHLVELGKLDDHQGFAPLVDEYRKNGQLSYGNLAENILMGYPTPQAAVAGWDGSLGHQALMRDGSYVWGCAAANSGFAVLIAAY